MVIDEEERNNATTAQQQQKDQPPGNIYAQKVYIQFYSFILYYAMMTFYQLC